MFVVPGLIVFAVLLGYVLGGRLRRFENLRIVCPNCEGPMLTDWYYGPGNIVIDTCPACDLVWLDAGELRRVVDAPGLDRRE